MLAGDTGRYAPSTTGYAHPGTLLAALLCWLDARSRDARIVLRLEDLDPDRCRPEYREAMVGDLAWLGLDFDETSAQSDSPDHYDEALDRLADAGLLYPCSCSRGTIRASGQRAPDGGFRYPNRCRAEPLPPGGWRAAGAAVRVRLPNAIVSIRDEGGSDLSDNPWASFGDPVLRRRDGAIAYHLASVVDDYASGVTRIVRGRDLAASTVVQAALRELLGHPQPAYRHHLLLLEPRGAKLAKLHGSVSLRDLQLRYDAPSLVGVLAHAAGLRPESSPVEPQELVAGFAWDRVGEQDRVLEWNSERLRLR